MYTLGAFCRDLIAEAIFSQTGQGLRKSEPAVPFLFVLCGATCQGRKRESDRDGGRETRIVTQRENGELGGDGIHGSPPRELDWAAKWALRLNLMWYQSPFGVIGGGIAGSKITPSDHDHLSFIM